MVWTSLPRLKTGRCWTIDFDRKVKESGPETVVSGLFYNPALKPWTAPAWGAKRGMTNVFSLLGA
jgi:hypothetical protein